MSGKRRLLFSLASECQLAFASTAAFGIHLLTTHTHICIGCRRAFISLSDLDSHSAQCSVTTPNDDQLTCIVCDASSMPTASDYWTHIYAHHLSHITIHQQSGEVSISSLDSTAIFVDLLHMRGQCDANIDEYHRITTSTTSTSTKNIIISLFKLQETIHDA